MDFNILFYHDLGLFASPKGLEITGGHIKNRSNTRRSGILI
jgi:hypothetical protein